jgi:hypothetical protein
MDQCVGAAARLPESDRKDLAVQALARSATVSGLSTRHGVSRKFVYQQADKARRALDGAFSSTGADDEVLFEIQVTKRWLRQVIVALALMCRGSYLGIIEFMRDMLGDRDILCQRLRHLEGRRRPKGESAIVERRQSRPKPFGSATA